MRIELKNVNTNKLHDELIKAGIIPSLVESSGDTTWVTVEDSEESSVMAIVAIHDPSPILQPISEEEILKKRLDATENALLFLMDIQGGTI